MPSHVTASGIGAARDSQGLAITPLMWRANRLVDFLAKSVSGCDRLPKHLFNFVAGASGFVKHQAARLGTATYLANHSEQWITFDGGRQVLQHRRDTTAQRTQPSAGEQPAANTSDAAAGPSKPEVRPVVTSFAYAAAATPSTSSALPHKRKATLAAHLLRQAVEQEEALARCLSKKQRLSPFSGPAAEDRLDNLRARLSAKTAAAAS